MSRTVEIAAGPPKVSFTNWILGGDLITKSNISRRVAAQRTASAEVGAGSKPKDNVINGPTKTETKHHHIRQKLREKGTETEKVAEKEKKKNEGEIEKRHKTVPKDEVAMKEELNKKAQLSSGWTKAQDDKILSMKKVGNSWKMIAQEVGASKKNVMNRYRELDKPDEKKDADDDAFALGDMPGMFSDNEPSADSKPKSQPQKKSTKEEKKTKDKIIVDTAAVEAEQGRKVLVPDAVWTIGDLEVLASVEQRYRELKWMHVQAGFYNLTGRMVGSELIKAKFEQG